MADVTAVGISELYYGPVITVNTNLDGTSAHIAALKAAMTQVKNVHQDTWSLEEAEPTQDSYRNQLTQNVYRMGTKQMGDVTINFTIGSYDYDLKAALLGGEVIEDSTNQTIGWHRAKGSTDVKKAFLAVTEDHQVVVFPKCNVMASETASDGAISIRMSATVLEPEQTGVYPEYWFDATPTL